MRELKLKKLPYRRRKIIYAQSPSFSHPNSHFLVILSLLMAILERIFLLMLSVGHRSDTFCQSTQFSKSEASLFSLEAQRT